MTVRYSREEIRGVGLPFLEPIAKDSPICNCPCLNIRVSDWSEVVRMRFLSVELWNDTAHIVQIIELRKQTNGLTSK
jgi:hypothetical protein